jgi:hypothetical protein
MLTTFALLWMAGAAHAQSPEDCPPVEPGFALGEGAAPDESGAPSVLVLLPKDPSGALSVAELALGPGARIAESRFSPLLCATVARVVGPPGSEPAELIARLPASAAVVSDDLYEVQADPPPAETAQAEGGAPKLDPYREVQWAHDALEIDAAHARTLGAGVVVALLDSPADTAHLELRAAVAVPTQLSAEPAAHGTLIAGVIGAATGNGFGIAGIAPASTLLSVPACAPRPGAGMPDACRLYGVLGGLDAAWERRAQIVNLSLVGPDNRALERAIRRLDTLGVAVVAAAGNRSGAGAAYPAAYPWAIGVAATDRTGKAAESGTVVDLSAPGVEIVSTVPGGGFSFASGSSLAAAHASGVLALLTSASGGDVAAARRALFGAAQRSPGASARLPALAKVCDALALLSQPCAAPTPR